MAKIGTWINAARPRTLPLSISGILMGSGIAFYSAQPSWLIFGLALLTTILFQILSNFANDYGDGVKGTDNDSRIGPSRAIQSGEISHKQMKVALAVNSVIAALSAALLIWEATKIIDPNTILIYAVLGALSILAAISYTVGKKAYGYNGLGDIMVFIFFGLVSVLGVFTLYTNEFNWWNLLPATSIGLLSVAVLNLNNMRDYSSDKKSQKNTIVVKIGPDFAKIYHGVILLTSLICHLYYLVQLNEQKFFLSILPWVVLGNHLFTVMKVGDPKQFDPELKKVALSTFAISLIFFIASIL